MYLYTYVCMCECMYACMYVCMYVCMYAGYVHMYSTMCVYIRVHTGNLRTRTCASMYTYVCLYYVRIYVYI